MTETRKRSLVKVVLWRFIGVALLMLIAWVFSGDVYTATGISIVFHALRVVLHYFFERFWSKVGWGLELTLRDFVKCYGPLKGRFYFKVLELMEKAEGKEDQDNRKV